MFRTDIDALPIMEENDIPFKSTHPGFMHACGHDGHMAMMLGFADYLKDKTKFARNVLLVFQPAEEGPGGAKEIVKTGLLKEKNVTEVYGIHLFPNYEQGTIVSRPGPLMGSITIFDVVVHGESAHVAMVGEGIDALYYASLYYTTLLQELESKLQGKRYVCKFGKMESGTVRNIVSNKTTFEGTIRTLDEETRQTILTTAYDLKERFETNYHVHIDITDHLLYPAVQNDPALYQRLKTLLEKDYPFLELEEAHLVSEDFSFYQQVVPGVFYFLGTKNTEKGFTYLLHHNKFNMDENVLQIGVETYIKLLQSYEVTK